MKSQMTIGKKLLLCFGAMLVALIGLGYSSWSSIGGLSALLDKAVHKTAVKTEMAGRMAMDVGDMLSIDRGIAFRLLRDERDKMAQYNQTFAERSADVEKLVASFRTMVETDAGREALNSIQSRLTEWQSAHQDLVGLAGKVKDLQQIDGPSDRVLVVAGGAQQGIEKLVQAQSGLNRAAAENAATVSARAGALLLALIVAGLVVGGIVLMVVNRTSRALRNVADNMADGAEQVASAASEISSSSQSLAQSSSEQAASLEETSSSSEEISSMTRKNAENSKVAAEFTNQVDERVTAANQSLDQMVISMTEINNSSDKVSKIIKVIDEIAFQTNILALNAAVEAARAGEAGMGFAVVADEVRNLAQRCAQAAKDTASLIEESLSRSHDGMAKLDHVASATRSITESAARVKTLVDEVHLGSEEQARGIEQIAKAITQMEEVTQRTAANAEEGASASEELSAQAETMRNFSAQLRSMVGGAQQSFSRPVPVGAKAPPKPPAAAPKPVSEIAETSRSLAALRKATANRPVRPSADPVPAAAGKLGRAALPLDDDFKEF